MSGLRKAIKDKLPHKWEVILRQERCLTLFVDLVYKSLPNYMRGKGWKEGLKKVIWSYNNVPVYRCFLTGLDSEKSLSFWEEVERKIRNYELNLR